MDEAVIISFFDEAFYKKEDKIKYILRGVRPELSKIMSDWIQLHPFENPFCSISPNGNAGIQRVDRKRYGRIRKSLAKAELLYEEATRANTISDRYSLLTVIFSMVMFLAAIGAKIIRIRLSFTLMIVSGLSLYLRFSFALSLYANSIKISKRIILMYSFSS
jgi:hypothetical protein